MKLITPTCSIHHPFSISIISWISNHPPPTTHHVSSKQAAAAFRWCRAAQKKRFARLGPSETSGVFNCNENNVNTNHGRALQWLYHIHIYIMYIYMCMHLIEMNQKIQNMTELQYVFSFWHWQNLGYCSYAQSPCHFPGAPMEADAGLWWQVLCSVCSVGQGGQELVLYDQNGRWGI